MRQSKRGAKYIKPGRIKPVINKITPVYIVPKFVLLSYPRSGTNLLMHMIRKCGENVAQFHNITLAKYNEFSDKKLILIIRNYKECIVRNLYIFPQTKFNLKKNAITNKIINSFFDNSYEPSSCVWNYTRNIELYDRWEGKKFLIYYEDLLDDWPFYNMAESFNLNVNGLDWDREFKNSLKKYHSPAMSKGKKSHYEKFLKDPEYFDQRMKTESGELYDKYLKRYEALIHTTNPSNRSV